METKRLLTGFTVGFAFYFALLAGGLWFLAMILVITILGAKEYTEILSNKGFLPSLKIMLASVILFAIVCYNNRPDLMPLVFTISAFMSFMWVLFRGRQPYIANVATTLLGVMYVAWFPMHLLFLRNLGTEVSYGIPYPEGACYTFMLLIGVIITDTFCYYVGCKYGKHKLSKVISPNKTIEGAIGGTVMCVIVSSIMGIWIHLPWYHAVIIGLLIAVFAQIGDLCESMIKRDAGVKDSSHILPGHGGFLDRVDSYILTIPVMYYYFIYFVQTNVLENLFKGLF